MDVIKMSITEVEKFEVPRPYIIISITTPGVEDAKILYSPYLKDVCRVTFHDVDKSENSLEGCKVMIPMQAECMANFVKKYKGKVSLIVVHCGAGVSRSAGVAMAIRDWLGLPSMPWYGLYNSLCYRLVTEALRRDSV